MRAAIFPLGLVLRGRPCVVIGGGAEAERKVEQLLEAGARVTVISAEVSPRVRALDELGTVRWLPRGYRQGDLRGALLAISAPEDPRINRAVWEEAEEERVLLNALDDIPHCHAFALSTHRQGDLTLAVSTAGRAPALGVRLRQRIAGLVGPEHGELLELLGGLREEVARRLPEPSARRDLWYRMVDSDALEHLRRGDREGARGILEGLLDEATGAGGSRPEVPSPRVPAHRVPAASTAGDGEEGEIRGSVTLVGAGPGDPKLITLKGLEALRRSEVVVYDRLVHPDLLSQAPATAERIYVGKHAGHHSWRQEDIHTLLIDRARNGYRVTRLKGGDPFVFGRGGEEVDALRRAGIPCEVVPGVSSAVAAPGAAGIPITDRRYGSAVAFVTGHECAGESDLDWQALARLPTLVILMGLRTLPAITARLLAAGADPATPAAVIADGTLPTQRTVDGTLATLAERVLAAGLEPPATVVLGEVVRLRQHLQEGFGALLDPSHWLSEPTHSLTLSSLGAPV